MKLILKGFQNRAEIDAKTHQKSMPKLVSKKIKKIIKNYVSLKGKINQTHLKNNGFEGLAGCVRERKRYQNNVKNETQILPQIDKQSMRKRCSKK